MARYIEENLNLPLSEVLEAMHDRVLSQSTYFGVRTLKSPLDFWVYQELIYESKPDVIIEIGTRYGGSALAFAHLMDLLGNGKFIGIDLYHDMVPNIVKQHPRITLIEGDACDLFAKVKALISGTDKVMIIEDSSHTYENTLRVLRTYSVLIKPGDYFIVEDGISQHGLSAGPSPGPYEAVEAFVKENTDFVIDRSKESFFITWNPKGFLRRQSTEYSKSGNKYGKIPMVKKLRKMSPHLFFELITPPIIFIIKEKLKNLKR